MATTEGTLRNVVVPSPTPGDGPDHVAPAPTVVPQDGDEEYIGTPEAADPPEIYKNTSVTRLAKACILFIALVTFFSPCVFVILLRLYSGFARGPVDDVPGWIADILPVFYAMETGPFSWAMEHWEAIPMLVMGAVIVGSRSRLTAAKATLLLSVLVAIVASVELYFWGALSDADKRTLAASVPGETPSENLTYLSALYEQVKKTQNISVAFFAAVAGGTYAARTGRKPVE